MAGRDYVALFNQSLQWLDGDDLEKELYVRVLNDGQPQENAKSFALYLHDANGATLNPDRSRTQIILAPPSNLMSGSFRLLQAMMTTVESATTTFEIPVVWEGGTTSTARLAYEVVPESASADDFTVLSPPILSWIRGQNATQWIRLAIKDDGEFEGSETLRVKLLPPRSLEPTADELLFSLPPATLGNISEAVVTITGPNNVQTGVVQFEAPCFPACPGAQYTVMDGGLVRAFVQRRNGSDGFVQARVVSVDGTARAGVEFKRVDRILRWEHGVMDPQPVLVETIAGVVRKVATQFQLKLVDFQAFGHPLVSDVANAVTITIQAPSNIYASDVNFVRPSPLTDVLSVPDVPFLPLVTRLDSGIRMCPRIVVTKPGRVTLQLRRFVGSIDAMPASVVVKSADSTAVGGVDYEPLPAEGEVVSWTGMETDAGIKTISLNVLKPPGYYTGQRSFFVEIASVDGAALGLCHSIEVVLDSVSQAPRVTAFDLDMGTGNLTLRMTNPVIAASLDCTAMTLQNKADSTATETFTLSPQSTTSSRDGTTISISMTTSDMHALKRFKQLATSGKTTFLGMKPGAFDYVLESCIASGLDACAHDTFVGIPPSAALAVTTYTPDSTRPQLLSFTMDMSQRLVKLRFSEPVDWTTTRLESLGFSDTVTAIDLRFLSSASSQLFRPTPNPLGGVLLNDGNPLPADATYLVLQLGTSDLASIRAVGNGQIGVQAASTFVTFAADFISDFNQNRVVAIQTPAPLLRVAAADCSVCPANTFLASSCSDMADRVCSPCSVCPTNSYALMACTLLQDTVCYPCTECFGSQYAAVACTPTTDRVCVSCTRCTIDEYEASPCASGVNRVCRTCDSCSLSKEQQRLCSNSKRWKRRQMKAPYGCPTPDQQFQTLEARLQRAKSNRCGAGRCSCTGNLPGNFNPNGDSFPDDKRCTGPEVYGIDL